MGLLEERQWAEEVHPEPGSTLTPVVRRKGVVASTSPLEVTVDDLAKPVPVINLGPPVVVGSVVWVDGIGDGRWQIIGTADNGDMSSPPFAADVSATGPGPDVWPFGVTWARVSSAWSGRPGGSNGILMSYNGGNFTPSYQTYFTGSTMYVRNRATATTWSAWRVAWGPV